MRAVQQLSLAFPIETELRFDTFVAPEGCAELVAALQAVDREPGRFYFLWGAPGVGKTHLLQAVCHANEDSVYVPLGRFADMSPAILEGLETLPVVCLDDIGAVLGDRRWEEPLFALFNAMREQGSTLVVSAPTTPRGLQGALPDLASRLAWGMVYHLPPLDDAGKAAVLHKRAANRGFELGDDVLRYILQRSPRDMTALLEVLDRLDTYSLAEKRRVTIPFVRSLMDW